MVREGVMYSKGEEWRDLMEEVRDQGGRIGTAQERFLERMGSESVGGTGNFKVMELAMAGGSSDWYNYQLRMTLGDTHVEVYREDREGLHFIDGGVMVETQWGGDSEVVVLGQGTELEDFIRKCDLFNPPIEYSVLDDPSRIFPD